MQDAFPPLIDPATLPRRALVVAPHPDDEVLGCGGSLAFHAERGDEVRVLVLSDGAAGLEGEERERAAQRRAAESRAAAAALGGVELRPLGLGDGRLGAEQRLVELLRAELEEFAPELIYAPSPYEHHPDHRATVLALAAALKRAPECRVLLYGVNTPVPRGILVDTTRWREHKRAALECFKSQGEELARKAEALDVARTISVDLAAVESAEGFVDVEGSALLAFVGRVQRTQASLRSADAAAAASPGSGPSAWAATAVISTWNKVEDVCANLDAIRAQTRPFDAVVVVDNCSSDATVERIAQHYPEVRLIVMPHSAYGACETFNIGFASATTALVAILDDDVVLPPEWLQRTVERLQGEPETTAIVSTEVIEPGMPESYIQAPEMNRERYMSTFRGCASLARLEALRRAGFYDERLFIYGNERDLTCRLLNLGFRVLQFPGVRAFHKTPFGIKMGKRSLYYHARNAWLTMLKYAPAADLARMPWLVLTRVLLRRGREEASGQVSDATGTIGIGRSVRETKGSTWVLLRAAGSVLRNLPYCWRHRRPVRAPDFELPLR